MIAARRPPAPEPVKKFVRPSAIGRLARSAALLLILRQPSSAKRVKRGDWRFFTAAFFSRHRSEPNLACPHGRDEDGHTTTPPRPRPHLPDRYSKPAQPAQLMRRA